MASLALTGTHLLLPWHVLAQKPALGVVYPPGQSPWQWVDVLAYCCSVVRQLLINRDEFGCVCVSAHVFVVVQVCAGGDVTCFVIH